MKKTLFGIAFIILALAQLVNASTDYRYVSAEELKQWLETSRPVLMVDIQEEKDFAGHHIKESLGTAAYPVKSDAERQLLTPALQQIGSHDYEAVVVVCPRGKGGAKRTYDFLKEKGVQEDKLFILTGGMGKWPYREWVAGK